MRQSQLPSQWYIRFNRVSWGFPNILRSRGIIAASMENGVLGLWDPEKLLEMSEYVFHKLMLG